MDKHDEFDRVYGEYFPKVYAYFALCFSTDAADDLSQQVFLKVWKSLAKEDFYPPDSWKAWIFRIAVNEKNSFLRYKYSRPCENGWLEEAKNTAQEDDLTERMATEKALSLLKLEDRELLLKGNGFSSGEIGQLLHLSDSTVRSRVAVAKGRFADYLKKCGVSL